jgi:hypothetical protein
MLPSAETLRGLRADARHLANVRDVLIDTIAIRGEVRESVAVSVADYYLDAGIAPRETGVCHKAVFDFIFNARTIRRAAAIAPSWRKFRGMETVI